jgi:hypothetical protein
VKAIPNQPGKDGTHVGGRDVRNDPPQHLTSLPDVAHPEKEVFAYGEGRGRRTVACMSLVSSTGTWVVSMRHLLRQRHVTLRVSRQEAIDALNFCIAGQVSRLKSYKSV